jgi:2-oxoisovalerate dehydrogenase E1 component alpha subunit
MTMIETTARPARRESAHFEIGYTRYLDPDGKLLAPLPPGLADPVRAIALYGALVRARSFDQKAVAMQRTGRLGTYASSLGQEAVAVGAASAMRPEDVFVPSFREHAGQLVRGVTPRELFLYWGGDERGNDFSGPREDLPNCVPIGSHAAHAAGVALAFRLRREPRAVVAIFGDGATSKGDVAEAFNFAGVWKLPVVFVISNNQWAISVPRRNQSAAETLAQKAIAAGIPGEQVDGNDVFAVHAAVAAALERARAGGGTSVIEAVTYRLGDHTTADDASRYRNDAEVKAHWQEEPIKRLEAYLVALGRWGKDDQERLLQETMAEIDAASAAYLATAPQALATIFDFTYANMPADLQRQKDGALASAATTPVKG